MAAGNREIGASVWTDERREVAMRRWLEGASATMIAKELNCGVSRNAVIGLVHRKLNGMPGGTGITGLRIKPAVPRKIAEPRPSRAKDIDLRRFSKPVATLPPRPPIAETVIDPGATSYELPEPHQCKWPIGDPRLPGFGFCSGTRQRRGEDSEAPYCERHELMSRAPPNGKTKKWDRSLQRLATTYR